MGHVRQQRVNRRSGRRAGRHGSSPARRRLAARRLPAHWLPAHWLPAHWLATAVVLTAAAALLIPASPAAARPAPAGAAARDPGAQVPVLAWRLCPGRSGAQGFECATARVPLDYTNPAGRTIQIAVIRHRATGPGARLGSLFFNPGGPGGAGLAGVVNLPALYPFFPPVLRQRFDVVTFDPRGVGQSTAVRCFPTAAAETRFFTSLPSGFPAGPAETRRWIAGYAALGRRCGQRAGWLLPHISTADVARDMDLLRQAVGDPVLHYLGVSYGTYLGATYANLFPGKAGALVLDGALAPTAWARPQRAGQLGLSTFLRVGMDLGQKNTLGQFLRLCGQAGPRRCSFAAGSVPATRAKYAALLSRLRRHPVVVTAGGHPLPVTYGSLVLTVANGLYNVVAAGPLTGWKDLANRLQKVWQATSWDGRLPAVTTGHPPAAAAAARYPGTEQQYAIMCADSPNPRTPATYPAQAGFGFARSGSFGLYVGWLPEACATWPATDAHGYYGPWNRVTAHPVLVVSTLYDPATPYPGAVMMTRELARARLLTVAGYGHTTLLNPSTCASGYEEQYFLTGALPPPGTVCHQDKRPF